MDEQQVILHTRAKVMPSTADYDAMLSLAREKAKDPTVFDEYEPVFWKAQVSSNRLDFYATSMAERSLMNYVEDLQAGISFQDSHDWHKLGMGQSIDGEMVRAAGKADVVNQPLREVYGTFFTLAGLELGGVKTDNFIAAIRSGIWRDVSIGFYARDVTCSICGKQSFHWWEEDGCTHLPGVEYEVGEGKRKKVEFAWASINDGRLLETSQVYDGATPEAQIHQVLVKANALAEERRITDRERSVIERRYHTRLREPRSLFAVGWDSDTAERTGGTVMGTKVLNVDKQMLRDAAAQNDPEQLTAQDDETVFLNLIDGEATEEEVDAAIDADRSADDSDDDDDEDVGGVQPVKSDETVDDVSVPEETVIQPMEDETNVAPDPKDEANVVAEDVLADERKRLKGTGIELGKDPVKAVRTLSDALVEARGQIADLREDAELGKQYRKDIINEALAEGVRAHGKSFRRDMWASMLEKASLDEVKAAREAFEVEAKRVLEQTPLVTEADGAHGTQKPRRRTPNAYKV